MIVAMLLALPGIALLAAGTPRQAQTMFRGRLSRNGRRALRLAGMGLLAASLWIALRGDDRARHLIGWIGTTGIEALVLALASARRASGSRA